jgi:hypothetical protein
MWTKMWTTCRRLRKLSIIINYLSHFNGGGDGTDSERSLGCNALIYNDAVFLNPFSSDLGGEHRAEPVPPKPHRLLADFDSPAHLVDPQHSEAKAETGRTTSLPGGMRRLCPIDLAATVNF